MKAKKVIIPVVVIIFIIICFLCVIWFLSSVSGIILILKTSVVIDGDAHEADAALGMVISEDGTLYATGYITMPGQGKDLWLAKFDQELNMLLNITINGLANGDDMGYTLTFDETGALLLIGYLDEGGTGNDIFIARFNPMNLSMEKGILINGPASGTDDGYGILYNPFDKNIYVTGTVETFTEGQNIYLAKLYPNLTLIKSAMFNGPANSTDKGRVLTLDSYGNLYISGSKSKVGTGYDLWVGKFDTNLILINEIILNSPTSGEDKGYGIKIDNTDTIFLTGTINHSSQGFNIFLAKYDTSLNQLKNVTLNGPLNGEDVAYSLVLDESNRLALSGVYSETSGGANIWVALFDKQLNQLDEDTVDGDAHGYDTGYGIILTRENDFYVSGFVNEPLQNTNIWIGRYSLAYI